MDKPQAVQHNKQVPTHELYINAKLNAKIAKILKAKEEERKKLNKMSKLIK